MFFLERSLTFLFIVVPVLISVAYLTLAERKIMGSMQQRKGPNVVGFIGLLQPLVDGLKLLLKESVIPINVDNFSFILAPILTLFLSIFGWCVLPFDEYSVFANVDISVIALFAISSLGVYGVLLSG
jgi:NADH-quinone oxidoreductase subunit H